MVAFFQVGTEVTLIEEPISKGVSMAVRILFIIGTIHWFLLAIGHPILVDINLVLGRQGPFGPEVIPDGDQLRSAMIANTWEFGWLGRTNAHSALSGFSMWLPVSCLFLGLFNVVIGLSRKLPRELFFRLTVLNTVAYLVFTVFAFLFFVRAPQFNGVVATPLFALAAILLAREQRVSG